MTRAIHMDRFLRNDGACPTLSLRGMSLVLGVLAATFAGFPEANADPVYTNKGRFRIPYQLDESEIKRLGATEIQLHVSTDNGRTWRHVDSVPPVEGKFTFDATSDGDYSFAVRTVDRRGDTHPAGPLTPSLQVTVDTTAPTIDIQVEQAEAGRVLVRWTATDDHLETGSLVLEHRDASSTDWQPMSIAATASGETSWSLADGGLVEVRGTVYDAAGNEASAEADANIEKTDQPAAAPASRQRRVPIADGKPATPAPATPESATPEIVSNESESLPTINPEVVAFNRNISNAPDEQPKVTQPRWDEEPAAEAKPSTAEESQPAPQEAVSGEPTPSVEPAPSKKPDEAVAYRRSSTETDSVATEPVATEPAATEPTDALAKVATPQVTESLPPAAPNQPAPLEEGSVRRVNSTTFEIAYQLENVGPSGIASIDLYLTENGGEKWFHYGADLDHRSPFQVTVPSDGTYGFAIRVKSGVGLSNIPPQPGDAPELTIVVDRQPPKAQLKPVQQDHDSPTPKLVIGWDVSDDALPEKPVELSYAEQAAGPWKSLNGWQANTGEYVWDIGSNVPPQVYLRLEARDAAGNTARVMAENPLTIDLSKPSARFLNVESIR